RPARTRPGETGRLLDPARNHGRSIHAVDHASVPRESLHPLYQQEQRTVLDQCDGTVIVETGGPGSRPAMRPALKKPCRALPSRLTRTWRTTAARAAPRAAAATETRARPPCP